MNLWVLFLCRFFIQSSVKLKKIIFTALLTAIGEVFVLCIPVGNSGMKIIIGFGGITALAIYWLFKPKYREYFYKLLMYSYLAIFILGGILVFLESILGRKKVSMVSWAILVVFLVFLIERVYIKINTKSDFRNVVLTFSEGRCCRMIALVDSGNGLTEPISKMPVSVIEERVMEPYKELLREDRFRIVPFHSVGKESGILEAYFIEKMEIENEGESRIIEQPVIAIAKEAISINGNYQMILHPELLKQGGINCDFKCNITRRGTL